VFWICVLVRTYLCLFSFSLFCIFVLGCGSLAPNEDIVRFRCGWEPYTLFTHIFMNNFMKNFQFLYIFLSFRVVCVLFFIVF